MLESSMLGPHSTPWSHSSHFKPCPSESPSKVQLLPGAAQHHAYRLYQAYQLYLPCDSSPALPRSPRSCFALVLLIWPDLTYYIGRGITTVRFKFFSNMQNLSCIIKIRNPQKGHSEQITILPRWSLSRIPNSSLTSFIKEFKSAYKNLSYEIFVKKS